MSTRTSIISSSSGVGYTAQLAQTSALRRSLSSLGVAIEKGELVPASSILTAFFKANPQYTSPANADSSSPNPLNQNFQTLAAAISSHQVDAAQTAWTQVKSALANDGVTNPGDGPTSTPKVPAQTKAPLEEPIAGDTLESSAGSDASITSLVGGTDGSSTQTGLSSPLDGNWLTYQPRGTTAAPANVSSNGNLLNIAA